MTDDLTPEEAHAAVDDYLNGAARADYTIGAGTHHDGEPEPASREAGPPPESDLSDTEGEDDEEAADGDDEGAAEKKDKPRQIDELVKLMKRRANLFHAPGLTRYDFYADISVGGNRQTHYIGSSSLNRYMLNAYYDDKKKALGQSVVDGANGMLRALAARGPQMDVDVRTSQRAGKYYLDLADPFWRAVEVSARGWELVKAPPVRFKRAGAMAPLCEPKRHGNTDMLRRFLNVKDEDSFIMVVAWLLAALRPVGPYPILVINGEQGSAKSTMTKILRSLVDPSTAPLRHASASDRDLFITAMHSWVLAFDNCSHMPGWLSDALCRLATGGGFATRALYTDTDEVVFNSKRPIILNGITEFVERGDLADRSVFVHLSPIPKTERKTEREVLGEFEKLRPLILGALLDAMVTGLRELPNVALPSKPRMAEFAEWAKACESDFTVNEGDFLEAYERNQTVAVADVVESDPVASAIMEFAHRRHDKREGEWEGNATELLAELEGVAGEKVTKQRSWPRSSQAMGRVVARVAPVLRQAGIPVERPRRTDTKRLIVIGAAPRPNQQRAESND
jgi:hypothetical protein